MSTRLIAGALTIALLFAVPWLVTVVRKPPPIRLGLVHSRTGPLADTEQALLDAELLAVEEVNQAGGLLGRLVDPVIADSKSDAAAANHAAEQLISNEGVCAVIGGWTAGARRALKAVVERHNHLLVHPAPHEGLELSENVVYAGAAPNQRIVPAVAWSLAHLGKRFFLVGADDIGSHTVGAIVGDLLRAGGGQVVGEAFVSIGSANVAPAIAEIERTQPEVVFSSLAGGSHRAFYAAYRSVRAAGARAPVITVGAGEHELRHVLPPDRAGDYLAASYFHSETRPEALAFVERFHRRHGADRLTSDAIQTAYTCVHLWAQAVAEAGTETVAAVRKKMLGQSRNAPEGVISIDPLTRHAWRSFAIGRFQPDGQLKTVWSSRKPIRPVPFPTSRSRTDWEAFLLNRFTAWGGVWENPVHAKW